MHVLSRTFSYPLMALHSTEIEARCSALNKVVEGVPRATALEASLMPVQERGCCFEREESCYACLLTASLGLF